MKGIGRIKPGRFFYPEVIQVFEMKFHQRFLACLVPLVAFIFLYGYFSPVLAEVDVLHQRGSSFSHGFVDGVLYQTDLKKPVSPYRAVRIEGYLAGNGLFLLIKKKSRFLASR